MALTGIKKLEPEIINTMPPVALDGQMVALDIEMFGQIKGKLHRPIGQFACISVAMEGHPHVWQIYDEHDLSTLFEIISRGTWIFQNAMYDLAQLRRYTDIQPRYIWDTLLVERAAFGGYYMDFALDDLVRRWLGVPMKKDTRSEFAKATEMTPQMKEYAAIDAYATLAVALSQKEELEGTNALDVYNKIDAPALFPILDFGPLKVDVAGWEELVENLEFTAMQIQDRAGVNVYSPQQVRRAATEHGIHLIDTKAQTLEEYEDVPFISDVIEARKYRKAVSTYGMKWLENNVEEGDLVYPSWKVTGAETGRPSCSNPNIQQIPSRKMPKYRDLFISKHGRMMVADVSQCEPRILAWHSKDEELMRIFRDGEDIHLSVARASFHDPTIEHDDPRRGIGKVINLATSYGMTSYGLARKLKIDEKEAEKLLNAYFMQFKGVATWIHMQHRIAATNEVVHTASGRPIHINIHHHSSDNNAVNAPIQGGASEIMKRWITNIWDGCRAEGIPYSVIAMIHDEVMIDPPKEYFDATLKVEKEAFDMATTSLYPDVKFEQEIATGKTWSCKK